MMLRISQMVQAASDLTGVPVAQITGQSRTRNLVRLRWAISIIARRRGYSYPIIGRALGDRDHTTIMYGVECGLNMAQCSGHFADMVADIEAVALVIARKQQDSIVASMVPYYRPYAVSVEVSYRA